MWLLLILAGCYRPPATQLEPCTIRCGTGDHCPGDAPCVSGFCGGDACPAAVDADGDGPDPAPCALEDDMFDQEQALGLPLTNTIIFAAYTIGHDETRASYDTGDAVGGDPSSPSMMSKMFAETPGTGYRSPHLTPDGNRAYVVAQIGTMEPYSYEVRESAIESGIWSLPTTVRFGTATEHVFLEGEVPSVPTLEGPRRMIVGHVAPLRLQEYVQTSADQFMPEGDPIDGAYFGLELVLHPQLSPDGLRLVFVGKLDSEHSIYATSRVTTDAPFEPMAKRIHDDSQDAIETHPWLAADCTRLFYTTGRGVVRAWP